MSVVIHCDENEGVASLHTFIIFVAELRLVVESTALPLLLGLIHLLERDALRIVVLVAIVRFGALRESSRLDFS